ncbi:MAG TPA: tetratricopeptide repeat protein [Planctomycetota bacterium]|jgi:predicted Zn-dependent protease|nr:tetratricopeptide repeat protein [Planctomycetota bacterium]
MFGTARTTGARRALALVATASLFVATASAQEKDSIQFKDGKTETGLIKAEDYGGITFNPSKGAARTVEWKEVAPNGVTYSGSAEFQSAKDAYDNGKFADALPKFEELLGDAKLRAVLKQNTEYYVATIFQRGGEFDKAIDAYKKLVADFPKTRWLMEVGEGLVACNIAKKDVAAAGKALDDLSAAATTAGVETSFNSAVNVLKGKLFEEQKKYPEAQAAYGVVAKAAGVSQGIAQQARLGEARCMVALNKKTDAQTAFQALTKEDAPNTVLAGAWNGLADLYVEDARAHQNDADKLMDALFCYLRGVVQYAPLSGDPQTEYKRSMKGSAEVFRFISQVEKNAERKKLYLDRANERDQQFKKEFPNG